MLVVVSYLFCGDLSLSLQQEIILLNKEFGDLIWS